MLKVINISKNNKRYIINFTMFLMLLFTIMLTFFVQFKVGNLQQKLSDIDNQILSLEDEIKLLNVEWVYLTRPERLRVLSEKYLIENKKIVAFQVKNQKVLKSYFASNVKKNRNIALEDTKENMH